MKQNSDLLPEYHQITEFLQGQASKIMRDVAEFDKVVIVNKNGKPLNVVISYDRYRQLKENQSDI